MKKVIILTFLLISNISICQTNQLKILENQKEKLIENIKFFNDSLDKVNKEINFLNSKKILEDINENPILGIARLGAKLKDKPDVNGEIILETKEETPIQILDLFGDYFKVCVNEKCGFMSEVWIKNNEDLRNFRKIIAEREISKENKKIENIIKEQKLANSKRKIQSQEYDQKMQKKYGQKTFEKMKNGYFWIGMNKEMATFAIGEPNDINKSVGSWGTHEQWVYNSGLYLYFENGKVTSYQN